MQAEQSARPKEASRSMAADQPMIKRGMLTAKAKNGDWKVRWCVLQGVTFGTFNSRTDKEPLKVVQIYGAEVRPFKEPRLPFGILLVTKSGMKYEMAADSETDQADWIARISDVAKHGTKSHHFATTGRTHSVPAKAKPALSGVQTTPPSSSANPRRVVDEAALRREVPLAAAASAQKKMGSEGSSGSGGGGGGGSTRKKMFASEGSEVATEGVSKKSAAAAQSKFLSASADPSTSEPVQVSNIIPQKILDLYEKNKQRLMLGGIGKEEFSRNSEVILQVLQVEQNMDETAQRYSKLKKEDLSAKERGSGNDGHGESGSPVATATAAAPAHASTLAHMSASAPELGGGAQKGSHRSQKFIERRDSMKFEKKHKVLEELCAAGDPGKRFKKMVKIGEGSFGMVFMAKDTETNQKVAIKKMAITKKNKVHLETELALHRASSDHPNVVPIIEAFMLQDAKVHEVWVVLQFLEYGALTETLTQLDMKEGDIAYICKELVNALSWLHSRNVVHRDIKSDNILLGSGGEVKLADFGLAIELVKGAEKRRSVLGTPFWMSPEIINGKDYDDKVDIWAMGVTTIEMMTKNPPYSGYPKTKALFLITSQGIPLTHLNSLPQWSNAMKDWLAKCLTYDPTSRPNIWKMAGHPFLTGASAVDVFARNCIVPMKGKVKQCVLQ